MMLYKTLRRLLILELLLGVVPITVVYICWSVAYLIAFIRWDETPALMIGVIVCGAYGLLSLWWLWFHVIDYKLGLLLRTTTSIGLLLGGLLSLFLSFYSGLYFQWIHLLYLAPLAVTIHLVTLGVEIGYWDRRIYL